MQCDIYSLKMVVMKRYGDVGRKICFIINKIKVNGTWLVKIRKHMMGK